MLPKKSWHADLEHLKSLFVEIGLIVSLGIVLFSLELNFRPKEKSSVVAKEEYSMEEEMVPITRQQESQELQLPKVVTHSDILNIVDDDVELEVELEIFDTEISEDESVDMNVVWNTPAEEEEEEETIFIVVEDMPIFRPDICKTEQEGKVELMKFIADEIKYPISAAESGITGRVYVIFVVSTTGKVTDIKVLRGVHPALDKEAVRVISELPDFSPGMQRGKPVKVQYSVPINFVLR